MSYASAITYIDELPPMVQLSGGNNPAGRSVRDDSYYKRNPFAPNENQIMYPNSPPDSPPSSRFAPPSYLQQQQKQSYPPAPGNDYYDEIIKSYPSVQSKIRPSSGAGGGGGKYQDELMMADGDPIGVFANGQSPSGQKFHTSQPANAQSNYLGSNLTASEMEQNLAVARNIPLQYNRPFAQANGNILYPIIEHNTPEESSKSKDMSEFEKEQLQWHRKLYYLFIVILVALILIFIFLCIILYKSCSSGSSLTTIPQYQFVPVARKAAK